MPRTSTLFDPRTAITWHHCYWADDPSWEQRPSVGQLVSTWRDGSGNGRDAESVAGVSLPMFNTYSVLNGRGVVYGDTDGTGTRSLRTNSYSAINQPKSLVTVGAFGGFLNETFSDADAGGKGGAIFHTGSGPAQINNGNSLYATVSLDFLPHLYTAVVAVNGAIQSRVGVDGVFGVVAATTSTNTQTRTQLFSASDASTYPCKGFIAFHGLYVGDITTHAQWGNFKEWVRSYYGINVARGSV